MKPERVRFELCTIRDRINDLIPEYQKHKASRQENITEVRYEERHKRILIKFNSYLYEIKYDEDHYVFSWYRKFTSTKPTYIKDGNIDCEDLSKVIQTFDAYLYGSFNPDRGAWWQLNKKPKHYGRKKNWGR